MRKSSAIPTIEMPMSAIANGIPPSATMTMANTIHGIATPTRAMVSRVGLRLG